MNSDCWADIARTVIIMEKPVLFLKREVELPHFLKKGTPEKFNRRKMTWKDIIPDFLIFIIPVIAGAILLLIEFQWTILILVIVLLLRGFFAMQ